VLEEQGRPIAVEGGLMRVSEVFGRVSEVVCAKLQEISE
jgi:hypothetical protein